MQFVRLRLSGFKSFVEPTEFPIEKGLTGVVGPNGCGKSNLVEALRWVMGENRARLMRGGEMDDVIFAGTAGRPARNVAEVALHIDNASGRAPAPFDRETEFEVVRRIERGQGSAFRVAGRDVRMRDVQLLFADVASGAHSPALVSQGRIAAIIAAKPTERRALIEEAAGITGLHARRHEAELKLKGAEANLDRLDDVLATLDAQYQALKKQARQAQRYRNLSDLIRRAEAVLLTLRWREAVGRQNDAQAARLAAETRVEELSALVALRGEAVAAAGAQLPDLRREEAGHAQTLARLGAERDGLDAEQARVTAALRECVQRLDQIARDRAREEALAADATVTLARIDAEREQIALAARGDAERIEALDEEVATARVATEALDAEVARMTEAVAAAEAERTQLERRAAELAARTAELAARLSERDAAASDLALRAADTAALDRARAELESATGALDAARARAELAALARQSAQDEAARARDALSAAQAELARLDAEARALAALLAERVAGDYPPAVDALQVAPGYEVALGAGLGDDLIAALDGAAPVHWRDLAELPATPPLPDGIEPLAKFVTGPHALSRRLAQVGVVPDGADGAELLPALAQGQRLVSRAGALWRWDGFTRVAGAPSAAVLRLAQRQRLEDLEAARTAARAAQAACEERARGAAQAAAAAASEDVEAGKQVRAVLDSLARARESEAALAREAADVSARLARARDDAARLTQELERATGERAETLQRLAALPDAAAARERLTRDRGELAGRIASLAALDAERSRLARAADDRTRRLRQLADEEGAWRQRGESAARQMSALDERAAAEGAERTRLESRPAEIAAQRERLVEDSRLAEQAQAAAAERLAAAEAALTAAEHALKAVEVEFGDAREVRVRAQAEDEQAAERLAEIVRAIRERLECAAEDALATVGMEPDAELPGLEQAEHRVERLTRERDTMGPVNLRAEQEAAEIEQQIASLTAEKQDLVQAIQRLRQGISSLNREGRERLMQAFETVNKHFESLFVRLFGGGRAHLSLAASDPAADADPLDAGLEVMASPPGKKLQSLTLLSGGEQALTATALLFAAFLTNPAPICVLDEVDAPLDDANVDRFCTLLEEIAETTGTRFLVVTHHRLTMARMHRLFGVTMAERGISQLVSVDLGGAVKLRAAAGA